MSIGRIHNFARKVCWQPGQESLLLALKGPSDCCIAYPEPCATPGAGAQPGPGPGARHLWQLRHPAQPAARRRRSEVRRLLLSARMPARAPRSCCSSALSPAALHVPRSQGFTTSSHRLSVLCQGAWCGEQHRGNPLAAWCTAETLRVRVCAGRSDVIAGLRNHIVVLAQHKFASNVIEKCLQHGDRDQRT